MAKLQLQKSGSYTISVPKNILIILGAEKGDELYFSITEKGKVEVIKIERVDK